MSIRASPQRPTWLSPSIVLLVIVITAVSIASCGRKLERQGFQRAVTYSRFVDRTSEPFGIVERDSFLFVSDGQNGRILRIADWPERSVFADGLNTPSGLAFDPRGNLLVADSGSNTIKLISPAGAISIFAGVTDLSGFADGFAPEATFNAPVGIASDPRGRIYVSDTYNDRIRVISNGTVSTVAGGARGYRDGPAGDAQFDTPLGLAMWGERLLICDAGNRRIRVLEPDGFVWTLAGDGGDELRDGPPSISGFVQPTAITVSQEGIIYVADGNAIRAIGGRTFAFVETISGGRFGFRNGPPMAAEFSRPSGIVASKDGDLIIADSENGLVRKLVASDETQDEAIGSAPLRNFTAEEFRRLQPPRWPFDPPDAKRDIAGTLGEIRGEYKNSGSFVRFHNGLDIAGGYGETARFLRDEKVLDPTSASNFGTLRELLRMPAIGYIHINLGREANGRTFDDPRFVFSYGRDGKMNDVRVPRGATFRAGERIGTLNAMNHVHMIAGPTGGEMNALAALVLPGVGDSIAPVIEEVTVFDENWREIETNPPTSRIKLTGKSRVVVRAYDRMDGNPERRKLGVYRVGYQLVGYGDVDWTITFDRNPPQEAVKTVYAMRSMSGPTGTTVFNYIVTNRLNADGFREGFIDANTLVPGVYTLRVLAADFFGNQAYRDIQIEVIR